MEMIESIEEIRTQQEFQDVLGLEKVIIYFLVDWSGQERISRAVVYHVLRDLDINGTPVFQIDCSDQSKEYVLNWLSEQRNNKQDFYYGGYGEIVLVNKGTLIDFIKYPGQLELEKLREKIIDWKL